MGREYVSFRSVPWRGGGREVEFRQKTIGKGDPLQKHGKGPLRGLTSVHQEGGGGTEQGRTTILCLKRGGRSPKLDVVQKTHWIKREKGEP